MNGRPAGVQPRTSDGLRSTARQVLVFWNSFARYRPLRCPPAKPRSMRELTPATSADLPERLKSPVVIVESVTLLGRHADRAVEADRVAV